MKYSGIGGQAVMEGVMMKNQERYAVAVRKPDGEIAVEEKAYKGLIKNKIIRNIPVIRGVFSFIESLVLGISTLTYSASFYEDEEDEKDSKLDEEARQKKEKREMGFTVAVSFIIAVAVFMVLPYYLSLIFQKVVTSHVLLALIEGLIRLVIFLTYITLVSRMEDIQRVFMYHGAEHKCINCIEHGMELNTDNVRKSSRLHKRCGTSFLLFVMLVSIIFFAFIDVKSRMIKVVLRLALIPVIAGVSYELIKFAGKYDNPLVNIISKPGMWLQKITTREPDDAMIEVGIASVEAVFDWRQYLKDMEKESIV